MMKTCVLFFVACLFAMMIDAQPLSGTYTIGASQTSPNYTKLTDAIAAINSQGISGPVIFQLASDYSSASETYPLTINSITGSSAANTVTIKPAATVNATISGSVSNGTLIKLNDADYIIIDGSNNGTNSRNLTITNTSTTSPTAIWLASSGAGADHNSIKNCNISTGSNAATSYGIAIGGSTLGSNGADNDNVTIQNNNITQVYFGIWASGSASISAGGLDNLDINNNIIGPVSSGTSNIGFVGINISNAVSPLVSQNTVQNISSATSSAGGIITASTVAGASISQNTVQNLTSNSSAGLLYGILVNGVSGNSFTVNRNTITSLVSSGNNYVAGIETTVSGTTIDRNNINTLNNSSVNTYGAFGINLNGGNNDVLTNNFVAGITGDMTGGAAFSTTLGIFGIRVGSGTGHKFYHNSVNLFGLRSGTSSSSLLSAGFALVSASSTGCDVRNNIFSNTMTGGSGSVAYVSVFLPASGTTAMELIWNNNAYYTGTTAGVHGVAHAGTSYAATPAGPATYAGLYTAANFSSISASPSTNFRSYTSTLLTANTNNDNASYAFSTAAPFTSSTNLHIPAATTGQLESSGASVGITVDIDGDTRPGPAGSVNGGASAVDIGADEFDGVPAQNMAYVSSTTTQTNTSTVLSNTINQQIIGIEIVTSGTLNPINVTSFTLHTNGTTNTADITNARLWYTSAGSSFAATTQFGSAVAAPSGSYAITGSQTLVTGTNYFWLTYDLPCTASPGNHVDGECNSLTVGSAFIPAIQAPAGSRTIVTGPLTGTKTVGTGGDYATLTDAVAAINAGGLSGNVTLNILNNLTEPNAVTINQWAECGAGNYTLTIKPAASVNATLSANSATAVININGADRVIIDGSNNGTSSRNLTITNTNTGAATAVIWLSSPTALNGATSSVIKNCIITGNASTTTGYGIISGGTGIGSNALAANNNTTIQNNIISKAQYGVSLQGVSVASLETGNQVIANAFGSTTAGDGFKLVGIMVQFQDGVVIRDNEIQNIVDNNATGTSNHFGIGNMSSKNALIEKNKIHFINYSGGNVCKLFGILTATTDFTTVGSPSANRIFNNTVYDITSNSTSAAWSLSGIDDEGGYGDMFIYNSVYLQGNLSGASTATASCFTNGNGFSGSPCLDIDVENNIFYMKGSSTTGTSLYAHYTVAGSNAGFTLNYNDLLSSVTGTATAYIGHFNTANYSTLAAWRTISSEGLSSISSDPFFAGNTNLQLLVGSPAANAARPIVGITTDITGVTRSVTTPTMGAYEQTTSCGIIGLTASNITATTVDLNWNVTPTATGYEYAITTSATPPVSGTSTTNNFVTGAGPLLSGTSYYVHVRSNCGSFGSWTSISFTTTCATYAVPYTENFDGVTSPAVPNCMTVTDDNTDNIKWTTATGAAASAPNSMYIQWNSSLAMNDWFFTPGLNLTGGTSYRLMFKYRTGGLGYQENLKVMFGTAAAAGSMTTLIHDYTSLNNTSYQTGVFDFVPSTTGVYYVGFQGHSAANQFYISVDDINIDVTPTCPSPTSVTVIATGRTSASVSFSPSTGTNYEIEYGPVGFAHGSGTIVAGTGSPISITGIVLADTTLDVYVRQVCSGIPGPWTIAATKFLRNDDAAGALLLTVGAGCSNASYTNDNATASTNEVYPSCSGSKEAPVWFKFRAPASGAIRISTDVGSAPVGFYDTKLGLFSASDSSNYSTFSIISCDDDGGSNFAIGGFGYASVVYATGLTPNAVYWIAVDKFLTGSAGTSGNFCITVDELSSSMLAISSNNCNTINDNSSPAGSNAGYAGWVPLLDDGSKLIALVKNAAGGAVSDYSVSMNVNTTGTVRTDVVSGLKYLDRNFHIDNAGGVSNAQVQLFFTSAELTALQAVDPAVTLSNLGVTRQTGGTCQNNFVAANGTNSYITQTGGNSVNGASWITFTTPGFSNFFVHTSKAPVALKVFLQGAYNAGLARHKDVSANWSTALNTYALSQPYNTAAFGNYAGTESVTSFPAPTVATTDVTDWVLLELRDAATPTTVVARRAAFVREDGMVVDLDGTSSVGFKGVPDGNYYIAIRHRNHLAIRTSSVMSLVNGGLGTNPSPTLYNLTTGQSQAYQNPAITTNTAMKDISGNGTVFGMWGGNANSNAATRASGGNANLNDFLYLVNTVLGGNNALILGPPSSSPVYSNADLNMDGAARASGGNANLNDFLFLVNIVLGGNNALIFNSHN